MDFFFCLPVLFGCKTTLKPEGDPNPRVCPRCNNVAATSAKSREWFELCFIPVIPMGSKHIWICSICQWRSPRGQGLWEPQAPGYGHHHPPFQQGYFAQAPQYPPQGYYPPR
ncbi:hypothetical protein BKA70DRAFT_1248131 [Coprinopsis sp. MPI-PUGE-AT-0042]|nr:hypothetical protein BKA70DRAFT_1248131 [Coprinopsis sp. MPI-PUGE-AT-0042]